MFDRIRSWFGSLFDSSDRQEQESYEFEQHDLYGIGDRLCRHYDDGVGSTRITHFGEYSMGVVLDDVYSDAEPTADMLYDLDRLLEDAEDTSMQAKMSGGIDPSKVEQFRKEFFDLFTRDQIEQMLFEAYRDARSDFALDALVTDETTDQYTYEVHVRDEEELTMDRTISRAANFRSHSVEMQNVAVGFDLVESNVTKLLDEYVEREAQMLWDELDVDGAGPFTSAEQEAYAVMDAVDAVRSNHYNPSVIVVDSESKVMLDEEFVERDDVFVDETGVMDVPFVVGDPQCGYRIERQSVRAERPFDTQRMYAYRMQWQGNYIVFTDDAVSGPVDG